MAAPWHPRSIATVRRSVEALNLRDTTGSAAEIHPRGVIVPVPTFTPPGAIYRGRAGAYSYYDTILRAAPDLRIEIQGVRPLGEQLLVDFLLIDSPDSAGATIHEATGLFTLVDGLITRVEGFSCPEEARDAAGRPPRDALLAMLHAPAPIVLLDDDGVILEANPAAAALFAIDPAALCGRSFLEFVPPAWTARAAEFLRAAIARGRLAGELALVSSAGEEHPAVEVRARANMAAGRHVVLLIPARRRTAGVSGPTLTPREREILELLAGGLTSPQIADRLGIALNTVRTHVRNATSKLDARTRVQAVAVALARGEIEAQP